MFMLSDDCSFTRAVLRIRQILYKHFVDEESELIWVCNENQIIEIADRSDMFFPELHITLHLANVASPSVQEEFHEGRCEVVAEP